MNMSNRLLTGLFVALYLGGCNAAEGEMTTVDYVDIERFMGEWYVIANIPTFLEKGAHNAVETYTLSDDGTIATNFTFRKDGFVFHPFRIFQYRFQGNAKRLDRFQIGTFNLYSHRRTHPGLQHDQTCLNGL